MFYRTDYSEDLQIERLLHITEVGSMLSKEHLQFGERQKEESEKNICSGKYVAMNSVDFNNRDRHKLKT